MKRMVDNKKLKEIEARGGTQWYEHKINMKSGEILKLITTRQDALKDGGWPNEEKYPILLVEYAGPDSLRSEYSFPLLVKNNSNSLQIFYINSSNERAVFTFGESEISTEEVTPL